MRVGIISVHVDYNRKGEHHRGPLQPGIGPLIAALLPPDVEVDVVNDTWTDPDWNRDYDLLFVSCMHSDFDRARQISHYWRRRGAKTVFGGTMASTLSHLCRPFFDAVVVGDPESVVPQIYRDFCDNDLQPIYVSTVFDPTTVPVPRFDLTGYQPFPISLEATRGCPFTCEFCALTGIGTRYHVRPPEMVVRDILEGQKMFPGPKSFLKRKIIGFFDNNIGGNLPHLFKLCDALEPLSIKWLGLMTFNAAVNLDVVRALSRSGCMYLFVGLESFNPAAIVDMNKRQNTIDHTKKLIDQCRSHGIILQSGLMISPNVDDWSYIQTIPDHLEDCGLYVPEYVCFECPIPGTPYFNRLASEDEPRFLPDAYLRDFNSYTLSVRPARETAEDLVEQYKWLLDTIYRKSVRLRKLSADLPRLASGGWWVTGLAEILNYSYRYDTRPDRTYMAGTEVAPPEARQVPLADADFDTEEQRRAILEPWKVTDSRGYVLPAWRHAVKVFGPKGRISENALQLLPRTA